MKLRFDEFELTLAPLVLKRHGGQVRARAQVLQLLELLASNPARLVTHAQIRRYLWDGRVVDFARSVHVCVRQLRELLGDDAKVPRYVETVPRQGYRFVASVLASEAAALQPAPPVAASPPSSSRNPARAGSVFLAIAAVVLFVVRPPGPAMPERPDPARDAYMRGRYLLDRGDPASAGRSVAFFLDALASDVRHAASHAALAKAYRLVGRNHDSRWHATKAVELDPDSADAHVQMAISLMAGVWNWDAAGRHLERALALDPDSVDARQAAAARYSILGDSESARLQMARALQLDPASTLLRADYGWLLYLGGDYEAAMTRCREALEIDPRHLASQACLERAAEAAGDHAAARAAALRMMELWGAGQSEQAAISASAPQRALRAFHEWKLGFYRSYPDRSAIRPADMAEVHAALGDYEAAIRFLEHAAASATASLPFTLKDPIFAPLHQDPRFMALCARLNLGTPAVSG